LVVDDSKPSRSIVARVLRELAFDCAEAANGEEALRALAAAGPPDLVTVNWHMPVMDGIELIRRLRGDPATRKLPLVMISTEHDRGRIAEALAAGADDYLAKPFTPEALTRKLISLGVCREPAAGGGSRPLKVLICDDSATIRHILSTALASDPGVRIAGAAVNGQACLEMLSAGELPDVVLLDVEMPVMDGLTALKEIRRRHPRLPVVMFSSLTERGAKATVDALVSGANDYVAKPAGLNPEEVAARIRGEVLARIKQVVARGQSQSGGLPAARPAAAAGGGPRLRPAASRQAVAGIVIAVSTGGPAALAEVLPACVPAARVPIMIVQHMPATFTGRLAERLGAACGRPVREGSEGMPVAADSVILAPGGRHLELAGTAISPRIRLTDAAPENSCRPAADVLFRSAVRLWGAGTLGVVLTGMGRDGLAGSRGIVEAGGAVIAQDEFTSVVWGMPGEVVRAGLADVVLPLSQIGPEIALRLGRRPG